MEKILVAAIEEGEGLSGIYGIILEDFSSLEDTEQKASKWEKPSEVFNNTHKSDCPPLADLDVSFNVFLSEITYAMRDENLGRLIYDALVENGLEQYEKHLGCGGFGYVFQIEGTGIFEGEKLALKLLPQASNWWFWSQDSISNSQQSSSCDGGVSFINTFEQSFDIGADKINTIWNRISVELCFDFYFSSSYSSVPMNPLDTAGLEESRTSSEMDIENSSKFHSIFMGAWSISRVTHNGVIGNGIALNFPKDGSLSSAYGVLLFDGEQVHYVESIDPDIHEGNVIIGVISLAILGGTLFERVHTLPVDSEAVKGFGRSLAQAIHELHGLGYVHTDIHMRNILLLEEEQQLYGLKLIDFGLARKVSEFPLDEDWRDFKRIMEWLYISTEDFVDPQLYDLLYHYENALVQGVSSYLEEEEILNHPYFA